MITFKTEETYTPRQLAEMLIDTSSMTDIKQLIVELDDVYDDWSFTEPMIKHFKKLEKTYTEDTCKTIN